MAVATLQMAVGQDTVVLITPQVRAASGAMTDHSVGSFSMTGRLEEIEGSEEFSMEGLSPIGVFNGNPVPHELNGSYRLSEMTMALPIVTGSSKGFGRGNVLQRCRRLSFYHRVVFQLFDHADTPAQVDEIVAYCVMGNTSRAARKPSVKDAMTLQLVPLLDPATGFFLPNPSFGGTY